MMNLVAFIICVVATGICAINGHPILAMIDGMLAALNLVLFIGIR